MSRSERRRKERQQRKTSQQQRPPRPDGPLVDFVVYAGERVDKAQVASCMEGLPPERATVSIAAVKGEHVAGAKVLLGDNVSGRIRAAGRGTAPFIVFLDAECRLTAPSCLDVALATLASGAGIVGGLITDDGAVVSAGYVFSIEGKPYHRFGGWSPENGKVMSPRADLQAVPFAFLATHRSIWRQLGLRPEFAGLPYADVDFCLRARRAGLPVVYDPAIHVERPPYQEVKPGAQRQQANWLLLQAGAAYDEWRVL